jgi:hypothetical protein
LYADEKGITCTTALKSFNEVVAELGPLIKAGQVNISSEEGADKGRAYGVSADTLKASDCKLDIVLANFDEKGDPEDWQHFTGASNLDMHLSTFIWQFYVPEGTVRRNCCTAAHYFLLATPACVHAM